MVDGGISMRWQGKVIGGVVGAILGAGPVGAALGALLGHQFDVQAEQSKKSRAGAGSDPHIVSAIFFRAAFACMGYIAKSDGRVSQQEIDAARGVMQQMHLTEEQVQTAIRFFNDGKQPGFEFERTLMALRQACEGRHDLLRMFLEIQMKAALHGSNLDGPARATIQRIAQTFGMSPLEVAHMEALLRLQTGRRPGSSGSAGYRGSPNQVLADAYSALEIESDASNEEVVKAYRRQMSRHHPDKLVANGLPESMMELAKQKTQEVREAYDLIREHRGMS